MLSLAMKKVVGVPLPGNAVGAVTGRSAKLCLRECVRASPPTEGRMAGKRKYSEFFLDKVIVGL